jgi:integrase
MATGKYRIKKYPGVYGYDSTNRRCGGKADVCYYIVVTVDGKNITEKIGWASEGYTPQFASELRGKRIRDARHLGEFKTSKEVREEHRKANMPIGEIMKHYFNSTHGKALKGRKTDLSRWQHHLIFLEDKSVKEISQIHVERIRRDMMAKELGPATINHALRLLRRIINYGVEHGLCPTLDFTIKFQKVNNILTEFLTPDEASRLLDTLNNWPRQDIARMVKLAMFSGMRRGELFKLKKEHLDFQHSFITIANPKGGKDAAVPMSTPVRELLEQQLAFLKKKQNVGNGGTAIPLKQCLPGRIAVSFSQAYMVISGRSVALSIELRWRQGCRSISGRFTDSGIIMPFSWPVLENSTWIRSAICLPIRAVM